MSDITVIDTINALTIVPVASIPTLLAVDKTDILGKLRAELAGYVPDASTQSGRDEIGSKAKKVGSAKQDFVRLAAAQKEEHQKIIKAVNAELGIIEESCDELRDAILAPRVKYLQIEKDRIAAHEAALLEIAESSAYGQQETASEIEERLNYLTAYPSRDWQEFAQRAGQAIEAEIIRTKALLSAAQKREAEAAELAKLRAEQAERERIESERLRIEREEALKAESAAQARKEAEDKAAAQAQEAAQLAEAALAAQVAAEEKAKREAAEAEQRAQKAEADRIAAEERAKADAEAAAERAEREKLAAVEAERQRAAAQAKADADAAAKREADKKHKAKIHNEALTAIIEALDSTGESESEKARAVVVAIASGKIPHVKISY